MKPRSITLALVLSLLLLVQPGLASGTLLDIGTATYDGNSYNLIYDNISPFGPLVWLDYTRPKATWPLQVAWANSLNTTGVLIYNFNPGYSMTWEGNWRLPNTLDGLYDSSTTGYNITSSEMGSLYYDEFVATGNNPFINLDTWGYWSGTMLLIDPLLYGDVWMFYLGTGYQRSEWALIDNAALGVRPGQLVEAMPVPEPSTILLLGVGLAGLAGVFFRVKQHSFCKFVIPSLVFAI